MFAALLSVATLAHADGAEPCDCGPCGPSAPVSRVPPGLTLPARAAGRPGDFLLQNGSAKAIIRARDGVLVDYFLEPPAPSSTPQLQAASALDGLTAFRPYLRAGSRVVELSSSGWFAIADGIAIERVVDVMGARVRAETRYTLGQNGAELVIGTRLSHLDGGTLESLVLGDRLRWGNSDTFIDGRRSPRTFSGKASRIGRKGAGGDLQLSSLAGPASVAYQSTQPGLVGDVFVEYAPARLARGGALSVRRKLAYGVIAPYAEPSDAATGLLEVSLTDERGQPVAAKLSITGLLGTRTPDFGNDGDETGANRFVWTGNGAATRPLAPGRYRVLATAGPERDSATWDVEIRPGRTARLSGRLNRVIETPGWISADLHLHQAPSPDADIAETTRVVSIAAEGVEFAVASDHYAIGDLAPALATLRSRGALTTPLRVVSGTEVTTVGPDFGHFNVFPLTSLVGIAHEDTTPRTLFAAVRSAAPAALLQVNHPRWPRAGYFQRYFLDPKTGRVPASFVPEFADDFDALEVFNGFDAWSEPIVRGVLRDYLHLVGRGQRYAATGNSDSHGLFFVDPGLPRNLIRHGLATSDAQDPSVPEGAVLAAIRKGAVVVTSGPIVEFSVGDAGPGEVVRARKGPVPARLRVRAAPWIDVSAVEIWRGARGDRVRSLPVSPSTRPLRLDDTFELPGDLPAFYVAVVSGKTPLPNVYRAGVRPFAFTNPIFVEP